ncbi:MAG: TolC family protein [Planctomycetaceae bacterium]|nr:MAG: TolC family protein [Planctomycetaceae bacterium]
MNIKIYINVLILLVAGCATQSHNNRSYVSKGINERTNHELGQISKPGEFHLPDGASLDDGLSEDEAVAIALWNNAQFQVDLAALGFARADLIEADMLANPVFSLLFPIGPKALEMGLDVPVDFIWQRPRRLAAAKLDAQSISENLIEHGLALIRNVRTTYADLWSAEEQVRLAEQNAQLQIQMVELAHAQLRAGDISELEVSNVYVDSLRAADIVKVFSEEAAVSRHQLNALLGLISDDARFDITPSDISSGAEVSSDKLLETAFAARPDLRAAELDIEAAGERMGWEKSKIYNFIAIIDAKDEGEDSLSVGPGLAIEIPIFNQNDGQIARAEAELEQAARQYEAVRQDIMLQVRQAQTRYVSAHEEFELWDSGIVPALEIAVERARKSLGAGEGSYSSVLEAQLKLVEARMRRTELAANLRRTAAKLNYCIGRKMI